LPKEILTLPKFGCINIHASLLPAYRGAAPINWAIIRGERTTGITVMQMDEGMDTGGILLQESAPIDPGTPRNADGLVPGAADRRAMPLIAAGTLVAVPQDGSQATLAPLLKKEDGLINWNLPAVEIHNRVRGLSPWPGAYAFLDGKMVKIIASQATAGDGAPGLLYERDRNTLDAGTGSGLLRIMNIQPGKNPQTAAEFLRGHRGAVGKKFGKS
jgi:methionyl-tRNA formyltransferase